MGDDRRPPPAPGHCASCSWRTSTPTPPPSLSKAGYQVEALDRALGEAELVERLAAGRRARHQEQHPRDAASALGAAPHLLAVGAFCIGTNQVDLDAASAHGVAVFNAPFSNTRSVVELVIAEIIALQRGLTDKSRQMHEGIWDKSAKGSHEVRGRRLGIVGYGNIGSQLSVLAESLGMAVWFYDTDDKLALGNAKRCSSIEELLEAVDIVTLHVDGRPGNRGLFGEAEFARMGQGSMFLNLSRGFRRGPRRPAGAHRERAHRRRRGGRLPERAQSAGASRSSPSCGACPTSS